MRSRAWRVYLGAGLLLGVLYAFVPPFRGSGPLMNVLGLSPVLAILAGLRLHRPSVRSPWRFFAAGLALFWLGDLYTLGYPRLFGHEVPFPSIGDGAYVAVCPVLMAGLIVLVRHRNPGADRASIVDSLIITVGVSLVSWVGLIAPALDVADISLLGKLTSIAYPAGDILLLAATVRLALGGGRRGPAFHLLSASIVALLVTDFAHGLITLNGTYDDQVWLDLGWIAFFVLWGAAALHPSMATLSQPVADRTQRVSRLRLALLSAGSLMAPLVLVLRPEVRDNFDVLVVVEASIILFALVVARMSGLIGQTERIVLRERILGAAGAALVAATDGEQTYQALLDGARTLAGDGADVTLQVAEDGVLRTVGDDPTGRGERLELPLTVRGEGLGNLVVSTDRPLPAATQGALLSLASQSSLALESAALTREVHQRRGAARFHALVQQSSDLITVLDAGGSIVYQSPSVERLLGYTPDEVMGTRFDLLVAPGESDGLLQLLADGPRLPGKVTKALECTLRHRDGSALPVQILHTNLLDDEHVCGVVLNSRDISERRIFEQQLAHQAFHDPVTGLANRALFVERVRHAVARDRREHEGIAIVFVDLDDFKTINDSLGHAAGDRVLLEVAQRLSASVRAADTAARFGGDEFAILLEGIRDAQDAADSAERVLSALAVPLFVEDRELTAHASLGIALIPAGTEASATGADELIRNADAAMYIAKREGKGGYRLFEPAMHADVLARLELRADLQRALTAQEFRLHYQPLVRLQDGAVVGFEALLRWDNPVSGLVAPDEFVPFAEETGLIVPIGRWVLREGCRQAVAFNRVREGEAPLTISINLSAKQLQHSDVVADVREALEEAGLAAELLTLEITETVLISDTELAIERLGELKALGVKLAMDDFGTGYSSLSYLNRFPVDVLKMDRSFLSSAAGPQTSQLASAVVAIGETLRMAVVAEGIEHAEQWSTLSALGCQLGQGFHFAKPMDVDAATDFLRDAESARA
jgi:diguanylate cyclase (GGDEF)-like protein/PAS domain S-box-containing protein